jgi:hypothetical protein
MWRVPAVGLIGIFWLAAQILPELGGRVLDPSGASVPWALVRLRCDGREQATTRTDAEGRFRLPPIYGRACSVDVEHEHFQVVSVPVQPGATPLRITLPIAPVRQQLTVSGQFEQLSINPEANRDIFVFNPELLDGLPALDRDPLNLAARYLDPALGGAVLLVDGMETNRVGVTRSAIQEVRINRNPYSAEFGSPGRGRIEFTTRAGTARLHGSAAFVFRDHRLNARNAFASERPPEQRRIFEGHLTGPLPLGPRTTFLLSAERSEQDEWATVYARTPEGLVNRQAPQPERETELSFTLRKDLAGGGALLARYDVDRETARAGAGGFDLPETAYRDEEREQGLRLSWRALAGPAALHELHLRWESENIARHSLRTGVPRWVVLDAFTAGSAQQDYAQRRQRVELSQAYAALAGKHSIRAGFQFPEFARWAVADLRMRDGVFRFSSLADFLEGRPFSFSRREGDGRVRFWKTAMAGFVQDDVRVTRNLSLALGLRWEGHSHPNRYGNFAPRLATAWSPRPKLLVRAGSGLFYSRLPAEVVQDSLLLDGRRLREILILDPSFPHAAGAPVASPPNVVRLEERLRLPRLLHSSTGIELELKPKTVLTLVYSGIRGWGLLRSRDLNAPLPPLYLRPDPSAAVIQQIEGSGGLKAHTLEAGLRGEPARWFTGAVTYQLSRTEDDTDGPESFPADSRNLSGEWGPASFDRRHRFRAYGRFRVGRWFALGAIVEAASGQPYTLTTGRDDNRDGRALDRPAGVSRNGLRGPGAFNVDLRWSRPFPLRSRHGSGEPPAVELAVDAFNVINRVNPTRFVGNQSSPFFGRPVAAEAPRRLQLSLELKF